MKRPKPVRKVDNGNKRKASGSLWTGPNDNGPQGGITFSNLSKFLVCRERFRLKMVEGLVEDEGFNLPLEFGSMWHEAEEAHAGKKPWLPPIRKYRDRLRANHPTEAEVDKAFQVCKVTFPLYVDHWRNHPDELGRQPLLEEASFRVPVVLPSGRQVILRGKFDCVFRVKKSIWLQENKTKGRIDQEGIAATVDRNLQTMLYQIALRELVEALRTRPEEAPFMLEGGASTSLLADAVNAGASVKGVIYNVVRRPLADQHAIKQRKGREVNKKDAKGKTVKDADGKPVKVRTGVETERQFYERLAAEIRKDPDHYFKRWKVVLTRQDVKDFRVQSFDPILEGLLDWWEWIAADGFDNPWRVHADNGIPGAGIHFQAPWGVYNNMFGGFRGDFFDLLANNRRTNIIKATTLFPEL